MMIYQRCDEGKRLAKEYFDEYNKAKETGNLDAAYIAFHSPLVTDHTTQCKQCQNYRAWVRGKFTEEEEPQYPLIFSGGEVTEFIPYRPASGMEDDVPF